MEQVARHDPQGGQPVDDAAAQPDRGGLLEVAGRHRDLADPAGHPGRDDLRDQFLVEYEVVAVQLVRDRLEQPPAIGAQARVVLGQVQPECRVLEGGQGAVADEFPDRHPAGPRVTKEAAPQHQVAPPGGDRLDQGRDPGGVVLVVGVEHDDDVGTGREGRVVARLLVAAVASVLGVDDHVQP